MKPQSIMRAMMKPNTLQESYLEKVKSPKKSKKLKQKDKFENKNKRKRFDDDDWDLQQG